MDAGAINAKIGGVQNIFNNFAKCQRYNSQIITLQAQHGNANQHARNTGCNAANQQGQCKAHRCCKHIFHINRKAHGRKGAHTHKARVAKAKLAQNSHSEVQRNRQHHIGANGHQLAFQGIGQRTGQVHQGNHGKGYQNNGICNQVLPRGAAESFCFHLPAPTLSH